MAKLEQTDGIARRDTKTSHVCFVVVEPDSASTMQYVFLADSLLFSLVRRRCVQCWLIDCRCYITPKPPPQNHCSTKRTKSETYVCGRLEPPKPLPRKHQTEQITC